MHVGHSPDPERSRDRILADDELQLVWNAADGDGWTAGEVKVAITANEIPTFLARGRRHAFKSDILTAFRCLAERPGAAGPTPSRNPSGKS